MSEPRSFQSPRLNNLYGLHEALLILKEDGLGNSQACHTLLNDYNLEIGAGLGTLAGKV